MTPRQKWAVIFGAIAALANLATALVTPLCGIVFSPVAAAAAAFMAAKEGSEPLTARAGAWTGFLAGLFASIGLLVGAAISALIWNAPMIAMTIANARDSSDLGLGVVSAAAGALAVIALAFLVAIISTGISAGAGAVVALTSSQSRAASAPPPE